MAELVIDLTRLDPKKPLPSEIKKVIEERMAESGKSYQSYKRETFDPSSYLRHREKEEKLEKRQSPSHSVMKESVDEHVKQERKSTRKEYSWDFDPIDIPEIHVRKMTPLHQQSRVIFSQSEKPLPSIDRVPGFLDSRSYLTRAMSQRGSPRGSTKDPFYYADRLGSEVKNTPLVIRSRKSILGEMSEIELQAELLQLAKMKKESSINIVQRLKTIADGGNVLPTPSQSIIKAGEGKKSLRRSKTHTSLFFRTPPRKKSSVVEEEEIEEEEEIMEWSPEMETSYLSALEVTAILTQIEVALDELGIIENLLPKERGKDGKSSITVPRRLYESPEERFGGISLEPVKEDDGEEEDKAEIEKDAQATLRKLQEVRTFASDVLTDTRKSLKEHNSFWPLFLTVEDQKQMKKDERRMKKKFNHWDEEFEEKRRSIKETTEEQEEALAIAEFRHLELMDQLDIQHRTINAQQRYIQRWEKARQEQNRIYMKRMMDRTRKKLSDVYLLMEHESTRYAQVQTMGEEGGKTPEDRISRIMNKWEERRTKDVDAINRTILEEKYKLHNMKKDAKSLEKEYKRRERALTEFHRLQVLREAQISAAKRIQNWWRLILYNRSASDALAAAKIARKAILKRQRKMRARLRKGTVLLPPIWPLWGHPKGTSSIELKKKMESLPKVPYKPTKAELLRFKAEEKKRKEMEKKRIKTLDFVIETINKQIADTKIKNFRKPQDKERDSKVVKASIKMDKPEVKKSPKAQKISLYRREWTGPLEFGTRESWELMPAMLPHRSISNIGSYAERVVPRESSDSIKTSRSLLRKYKSVVSFPQEIRKRQSSLVV